MNVVVSIGDVLDASADVLISTANPWLNMSGGVNGAIAAQAPEIQAELKMHLETIGKQAVAAGSVVRTSAGVLPFSHIIHAVAIDPFYDSNHRLVVETLTAALELAQTLKARTIALPTLATGYGPMSIAGFGKALADVIAGNFHFDTITIVVRSAVDADRLKTALDS